MKKNGYAESTIKATGKRLKHLQRHCNLKDPEDVKGFIANKQCSNAFKETLIETYDFLMKSLNQTWSKPFYYRYDKLPKIPTEEKINMLISHASKRMALFLSMSRDLGTRPIELTWLKIRDINLQNGIVNITSAKHCKGRVLKLKPKTLEMLKQYINDKRLNLNDRLFPHNLRKHKRMLPHNKKPFSKKPTRPNLQNNTTIRLQTLQSINGIPQNQRPTTRKSHIRTQRPQNRIAIHSTIRKHTR